MSPVFRRVVFLLPPTGLYCRENRCQSSYRFDLVPSLRAPLEEAEGCGAAVAAGAEAWIIDAPAAGMDDAATLARLGELRADLVVIAATFGTLDEDLEWPLRIKSALPEAKVVLRGAVAFTMAEYVLRECPALDACLHGDDEPVLDRVVREGLDHDFGVSRLDGDRLVTGTTPKAEDLDALPLPDRSSLDPRLYRVRGLGVPQATVRVQRGCPLPCTYCLVHTVSGNRARHRSAASVAGELGTLREGGYRFFYLRAETFTLDRTWVLELCTAIRETVPDARWITTTRVECVDDGLIEAMAAAGCYGISFGIDVASEEIGRRVEKAPAIERARDAVVACRRHGVLALGYFMIGFAGETEDTLEETAGAIRTIDPDLLTIHFAHPYPGTRYWQELQPAGFAIERRGAQSVPALQEGALAPERLQQFARRTLLRHYLRPATLFRLALRMTRLWKTRLPNRDQIQPRTTEWTRQASPNTGGATSQVASDRQPLARRQSA